MNVLLVSVFLSVPHALALAHDVSTLDAVLAQYEATLEGRSRCYIKSQTLQEVRPTASGEVVLSIGESELYRKGALIDLYQNSFRPVAAATETPLRAGRWEEQYLWDGSRGYEVIDREVDDRSFVVLRRDSSTFGETILSRIYAGGVLEGYFPTDGESILTVLRDAPRAVVSKGSRHDDTHCLIEANIQGRGDYRIWFDRAHGCNICRAEVTQTGADAFHSRPGSRALASGPKVKTVRFRLHDVSFKQSWDVWVPVSGRWQLTIIYESGDTYTTTSFHQCMQMECEDDDSRFAEAFAPHVRDGTAVWRDGRGSPLREEWTEGRPQLAIDWRLINITDAVVDSYVADLKRRGAAVSLTDAGPTACDPQAPPQATSHERLTGNYEDIPETKKARQRYCGLYCIYAAARAAGRKVSFTEFLKPQYLGSFKGSSISELKAAARDHGLYAKPMEKLTTADLKASPYCCMLHVKPNFKRDATYDHYVLFWGMEDKKAVLYDPPHLRRVALPEIAPLWGGNALLLGSEPISTANLTAQGHIRFIVSSALILGMVGLVHWARRFLVSPSRRLPRNRFCRSALHAGALGAAALLGGLATNYCAGDTGVLANWNATMLVQESHAGDFLPRIGLRHARSLLAAGAIFVDARFRRDYEKGCIPGAMSIPVDVNETQYEDKSATIPKDAQVVVYCQSAKCGFASEIAGRLAHDRCRKVSIFTGGWQEWKAGGGGNEPKSHDAVRLPEALRLQGRPVRADGRQ